ncbi:hypothetical protein LWP59_17745 [Amycolatopsis acidiphila]|nr:hypothetical protein LWP59_17745 [Amycolatopsis acidiphila]
MHEAGRTPHLYGRRAREHLELRVEERRILVPGPVQTDPAQAKEPVDLVFLAVKATQIEAASPWLAALCSPQTVVYVLQNGVEQRAMPAPYIAGGQVIPSVVWFPAEAKPDGSVRLRRDARLTLPDTSGSRLVLEALRATRCAVELATDFTSVAWRKLLQNAVAGLIVLTRRRSGMYGRTDLADREAGRALEWDIRNGIVQRRGQAHGIPTPISDVVVPLIAAASDGPG